MSNWNNPQTVVSDEGATFEPWTNGRMVGYKVTAEGMPTRYVVLNPSSAQDTGDIRDSDVFVYLGSAPDTITEGPECFIPVWGGSND